MLTLRERVKGMFLGVAIGDALGMPVETMSPTKILERYPETGGRITTYLEPKGHKWYDGEKAGTTTDDWQLTAAVASGMMADPLNMDTQVFAHIKAYQHGTKGWGGSTRDAIRDLANGAPWEKSGQFLNGRGRGNGVVMKLSPLVPWLLKEREKDPFLLEDELWAFLSRLTIMTHRTRMALLASFTHFCALHACFVSDSDTRIHRKVLANFAFLRVDERLLWTSTPKMHELDAEKDDIGERLDELRQWNLFDYSKPTELFGGGSCYVYDSLPFTYAWYMKDPDSIETLYDCVSAGGDADSNGSMLASMMGARHGPGIFPERLGSGLQNREEVVQLAEDYCECFDIE